MRAREEPALFQELVTGCPPSLSAWLVGPDRPRAGGRENNSAVSRRTPAGNSKIRGSTEASLRYGILWSICLGRVSIIHRVATAATTIPAPIPADASTVPSTINCLITLHRRAPNAERIENSFARVAERA